MKLHDSLLRGLADMVVGDNPLFPRRSSYFITQFFRRRGLPFVHDGSTRARWVTERLAEINIGVSSKMDLPSDELVSVFTGLFDPFEFDAEKLEMVPALEAFNQLLKRTGLSWVAGRHRQPPPDQHGIRDQRLASAAAASAPAGGDRSPCEAREVPRRGLRGRSAGENARAVLHRLGFIGLAWRGTRTRASSSAKTYDRTGSRRAIGSTSALRQSATK